MMPKVNIEDSEQNGFVQDWMIAWANKHTVFGTENWYVAAQEKIDADSEHARKWRVTIKGEVEDAQLFQHLLDLIQETYDDTDAQMRIRETREHFVDRYKDLTVSKVIFFDDNRAQVEGKDLDGNRVWILVHFPHPVIFKRSPL
jgi:hypothetical protein